MSDTLTMLIDGEAVNCANHIDVANPATGEVFAQVPDAGQAELDRAVAAAKKAFPAWKAKSWDERAAVLTKIADVIDANLDELARMLTREQGKPFAQAQGEIMGASAWARATSTLRLEDKVLEDTDERLRVVKHEPLGVVCAISPWNFPVMLSMWKIGPGLLAGNTMVLKPSPFTPMAVLRLGELIRDVVPAGVLNIISGGDALGPMMTSHPGFAKISFTGSSATGRKVMESASKDLKRLTLELGGNDAAIVLPDVDIPATAEKLFWSAFSNSGQVCAASKRAYIHEDIFDEMALKLGELVESTPMGDGSEQGTVLGPIQNHQQFARVREIVQASEDAGHRMVRGNKPEGSGYFEPLTLVIEPDEDSPIVTREQFGPVLPLMKFSDYDDVVARANDTDLGLGATVWAKDTDKAMQIANRLETGNVWINEFTAISPLAPFGGHKQSGMGVENGVDGLKAYADSKTITIKRG